MPSLDFQFRRRLPILLQSEVAECGIACLAMIATYHGYRIDISSFRKRFQTSMSGISLAELTGFAAKLSLASRALRADLDELRQLQTPCILHWNLRHYVVMKEVRSNGIVIHDPAQGKRFVPLAELSSCFSGIVLELTPTINFEKKVEIERVNVRDFFRNVTGLKRALFQILLLAMCLEAIALLIPIGSQIVFDEVIVSNDIDLLELVILSLLATLIIQTVIDIARSWGSLVMSATLNVQWTTSLFDHLLRLPLTYFEKRHIGDIVSRFGSISSIQSALTIDLIGGVLDLMMVIGAAVMMIVFGGLLSLIAFASVILNLLLRVVAFSPYRAANEASLVKGAREDSHFLETIRGVGSIKSLDIYERRRGAWLNHLFDAINANLRLQKLDFLFGTAGKLLSGADDIVTLAFGARAVMSGQMTIGMLVAFIAYKEQFVGRFGALTTLVIRLRMLGLHTERIADIALAEPEERADATPYKALPTDRPGSLKLSRISYRYGEGLPPIISNLDLEIAPGECVAITGPSGCGKTTLLNILGGLLLPTTGVVAADGMDIRQIGLRNYRRTTATVRQDDVLFAGTIGDNISAFDPNADMNWIVECARMAAIGDEIRAMPMAFESMVGDMGSALSGGQRQRLFLARALYSRPRILLLDEATSELDEENEARINAAIQQLPMTRIMAAHRPSTIALAQRQIAIRQAQGSPWKEDICP